LPIGADSSPHRANFWHKNAKERLVFPADFGQNRRDENLAPRPWEVTAMTQPNESRTEKAFFPEGAIAFFAAMLLLYAAIWGVLYWIMIIRS
jgi:hypothetical protein